MTEPRARHTCTLGTRLVAALLCAALPCARAGAQRPVVTDSVTIRFAESELRTVVQGLAQYLDWPIMIAGLPVVRVTLETPRPVARDAVLPMLRGLLRTHQLELVADSAAALYRIESSGSAPRDPSHGAAVVSPTGVGSGPAVGGVMLFTLRLRHARAADVASTVSALYGRGSAVGEPGRGTGTLTNELRDGRIPPGSMRPGEVPPVAAGASVAGVNAELAGDVTIVPDAATNSLLVRASRRDFDLIEAAVRELDVRPLQVLIEVLIAEVRKDRGFSFGVGAEVPRAAIPGAGDAAVSGSTVGAGLGDFAVSVLRVGGVDLNATLRAAAARGDVTISSRPVVLAANNELAEILVGSQRPFVQVSRSLPTDAPQRDQVVQYKDVGTRLSVRPTISADGYVMLEVTQEVNAVTTETAFDAPVISTRSVQTRLLVKDGQTAVLGGLADRQRDANQSGVPVLSAIPFLGGLFGRASRRTTETELFLFLTPTVIGTDADVDAATEPLRARIPREARR